jgi:hypothetical protein
MTKHALISPTEEIISNTGVKGCRISDVVEKIGEAYPVVSPLFWASCPDECNVNFWFYVDGQIKEK